jgi:hypothetical protein
MENKKTAQELLSKLQRTVKVPKSQRNSFGNYNYRSCEDIVEAVKPHLPEGASLILVDAIEQIGDRYYVRATAQLSYNGSIVNSVAYAREEETKKGMDAAQITGAATSYARNYAINGLFCLDDTKDADRTNKPGKEEAASYEKAKQTFGGKATESQRQALGNAAKTFEISSDAMVGKMDKLYNVKSSKDLTAEQASELLAIIQAEHIN